MCAIKPFRDTELTVQELHFVYPGIVTATPHAETKFPVFPLITNHVTKWRAIYYFQANKDTTTGKTYQPKGPHHQRPHQGTPRPPWRHQATCDPKRSSSQFYPSPIYLQIYLHRSQVKFLTPCRPLVPSGGCGHTSSSLRSHGPPSHVRDCFRSIAFRVSQHS